MSEPLLIARTPDTELFLLPGMANRHGLITGQRGRVKLSRCKNWRSHCRKSACRCLWLM